MYAAEDLLLHTNAEVTLIDRRARTRARPRRGSSVRQGPAGTACPRSRQR
ncbi:hypothetical protein [Streptomyces sp. NPDC060035]